MESIVIDLKKLKELRMNVNQFLGLLKLYLVTKQRVTIPFSVSEETVNSLKDRGYLTVEKDEVSITDKGMEIFDTQSYFEKFFEMFPKKVSTPEGGIRVLCPKGLDTVIAGNARTKWNRITQGNDELAQNIIKGLENELKIREQDMSLHWMNNIETWLNKGVWEKYADLNLNKNDENTEKII